MKKFLILPALVLVLSLGSCNKNQDSLPEPINQTESVSNIPGQDYSFEIREVSGGTREKYKTKEIFAKWWNNPPGILFQHHFLDEDGNLFITYTFHKFGDPRPAVMPTMTITKEGASAVLDEFELSDDYTKIIKYAITITIDGVPESYSYNNRNI